MKVSRLLPVLGLGLALLLAACGGQTGGSGGGGGGGGAYTISGQLQGWQPGWRLRGDLITFNPVPGSPNLPTRNLIPDIPVDSSGRFTLNLPDVPQDALSPVPPPENALPGCQVNLSLSPRDVRIAGLILVASTGGGEIPYVLVSSSGMQAGYYFFVDRNFSLTGTATCQEGGVSFNLQYNVGQSRGWGYWEARVEQSGQAIRMFVESRANPSPGLTWRPGY